MPNFGRSTAAGNIDDARAVARETRKLIRSASAKLAGRERGPDRAVHRQSFDVHDRRAQVARCVADGSEAGTLAWIDCLVRTAREYDLFKRTKGGVRPLRPSGVAVLEVVLRHHWHDFKTGRIDPALSQIERATGYARQTVVEALARLEKHGFLDWVRRTEKVSDPMPGEPTRRQINNAYFVDLGQLAAKAGSNVAQRFREFWNKAKQRLALQAKEATPRPAKPAQPRIPSDAALARSLAAFGRAVDRNDADDPGPSLEKRLSPSAGSSA